jgi:hypothetical protein
MDAVPCVSDARIQRSIEQVVNESRFSAFSTTAIGPLPLRPSPQGWPFAPALRGVHFQHSATPIALCCGAQLYCKEQ